MFTEETSSPFPAAPEDSGSLHGPLPVERFVRILAGIQEGWGFSLADGCRWGVSGYPSLSEVIQALAPIMHLRPGFHAGAHPILFVGESPFSRTTPPLTGASGGWQVVEKGGRRLYYRLDPPGAVIAYARPLTPSKAYTGMRDALALVYWESLRQGGLPFHAALLEYQGLGLILAGRAGVGKSTCARRVPPPWQARADDEVLVVRTPEGRYLAHPFPTWSDYLLKRGTPTYRVEDPVPVTALCFLEQASEDELVPLKPAEAAIKAAVSAQTALYHFLHYCDPEDGRQLRRLIFDRACELAKRLPAFSLRVSLTGRFWEKLEAVLKLP